MTHHVALQFAARTDTGLVRAHNEDAVAVSAGHGIAVLADGMGGYNAGEIASGIATAVVVSELERLLSQTDGAISRTAGGTASRAASGKRLRQWMTDAVLAANQEILETARDEPQYSGMGTTLVAALFRHDRIVLAHLGDSRCYRFRQGELCLLTRDHSLLQEQIDAGLVSPEWARYAPNKNLITRALGVAPQVDVEINDYQIEAGDVYLLCSDGLSDMLTDAQLAGMLADPHVTLDHLGDRLVAAANGNGGRDNISAILVRINAAGAAMARSRWPQLNTWLNKMRAFRVIRPIRATDDRE
ncbi:Stp1/IreP family PP2C-type Ser/Thr phosphatase [Oxalicibacterium solurbis]|uniref:Protein phosphatase n=1 Tax=Oxalicibacterium solurbis TaxID=69280 RepID=A0A8J3B2Z0_9BURK|nr:Stp1/IreP family PP2C-type Ser/Thr phosphatase [Oxalicibacterium solurbis]GGI54143.1 protein phosphatase [Oxalicibacterium solurbis]